jgi:hypothetical protein
MDPSPIEIQLLGGPFKFCPMTQGAVFPASEGQTVGVPPQPAQMYAMANPFQGGGWGNYVEDSTATLASTDGGLGLFFNTKNLPKGSYTVWLVIYNDPHKCTNAGGNPTGQCDAGGDMLNQDVSTLLRGAGDVVDDPGDPVASSWTAKNDAAQTLAWKSLGYSDRTLQ